MLIKTPYFCIYFGDAQDHLMPAFYLNLPDNKPIVEIEPFSNLKSAMNLETLLFLHQTHSDQGSVVTTTTQQTIKSFKDTGDFLITNKPLVGIGVMTADCLPIILYDPQQSVVAIVHAGWKGSLQGIAVKTIEAMTETYRTQPKNIQAYFGPAAGPCCYKVGPEFRDHLAGFKYSGQVLQERDGSLYFDNAYFNQLQLQAAGVDETLIHKQYNVCTICNPAYYSFRRQGEKAGRQMTVVSLQSSIQ